MLPSPLTDIHVPYTAAELFAVVPPRFEWRRLSLGGLYSVYNLHAHNFATPYVVGGAEPGKPREIYSSAREPWSELRYVAGTESNYLRPLEDHHYDVSDSKFQCILLISDP